MKLALVSVGGTNIALQLLFFQCKWLWWLVRVKSKKRWSPVESLKTLSSQEGSLEIDTPVNIKLADLHSTFRSHASRFPPLASISPIEIKQKLMNKANTVWVSAYCLNNCVSITVFFFKIKALLGFQEVQRRLAAVSTEQCGAHKTEFP